MLPKWIQNWLKIDKKSVLERPWELLGVLGASWIDFLSIFIDFGVHLGTLLGGFGASWGSFLEAFGSLGASWGLSWSFLGSFCTSWVDLGCFFCIFLVFSRISLVFLWLFLVVLSTLHRVPPRSVPQRTPPCPAPQRTPARSTVSRPAAVPRVLPSFQFFFSFLKLCPWFPRFSSKLLHKKFQLTADSSAKPSSPICAFRFPREVRFTGAGSLKLRPFSFFFCFCFCFFFLLAFYC